MKLFFKTLINAGGPFALGLLIIFSAWNFGILIFTLNADLHFGTLIPQAIIGILNALPLVIGSGLLFGLLMALFAASQQKVFEKQKTKFEDEELLHDGPANHFLNLESVGGWLYLTDKRLFFRSHKFNIQSHEWSLLLSEIDNVQTNRTLGIMPNRFQVTSISGEVDNFVVYGNQNWREQILSAKTQTI